MRIEQSVVVVTGASSGIGRATAVALAAAGCRVALLARRGDELDRVVAECTEAARGAGVGAGHGAGRGAGRGADAGADGIAIALPTDVSDAAAVEDAARRTVERFGRLDGWVNCAAVTMFGAVLDVPLDDIRRVLDVNLMGYVHGARAALPRMIAQGSGVLVNVSSILGVIAQPYGGAYTMSKFAIRGLGVSLREELRLSGVRGVEVATVLPAAVDTPIYAVAANHSGRRVVPPPPVYTPERVAAVIVGQLRRPRREVVAGGLLGRAFVLQHVLAPALTERLLAEDVDRSLRRDGAVAATSGNLHNPRPGPAAVHGGWDGRRREDRRRRATVTAVVAGALAAATLAVRRRRTVDRAAPVVAGDEPG